MDGNNGQSVGEDSIKKLEEDLQKLSSETKTSPHESAQEIPASSPTTPSSDTPQVIETPTSGKKSPVILMASLILIVIALLVAVVYVFGMKYMSSKSPVSKACTTEAKICEDGTSVGRGGPNCEFDPCPTIAPTSTPDTTQDLSANWKTYTNSQFGLSFKFPDNWTVDGQWGTSGFPNFHYIVLIKNQNVSYGPEPGVFGITAYDNPKKLTLQEFETANQTQTGSIGVYNSSAKSVTLGNTTASYSPDANCEPILCSRYVVSSNSKIFIIAIYKDGVKDDKAVIDQILATFKFTEATPSGSPTGY